MDGCGKETATRKGVILHCINSGAPYRDSDGIHDGISSKEEAKRAMDGGPAGGGKSRDSGTDRAGSGSSNSELAEAHIPEAKQGTSNMSETEDCPNCGADLEATEAEIREYIEENGEAYCGECGFRIRPAGGN